MQALTMVAKNVATLGSHATDLVNSGFGRGNIDPWE